MSGVALARLLRAPGRVLTCVLAIAIAVGFAVLVQLAGVGLERAVRGADTVSVGGADVAVRVDWSQPGTDSLPDRVAELDEVAAVSRAGGAFVEARLPDVAGTRMVRVVATPPEGDLRWPTLVEGRWPSGPGEAVLTQDASLGQQVVVLVPRTDPGTGGTGTGGGTGGGTGADGTDGTVEQVLEVVGVADVGLASDFPTTGLFAHPGQALALGAGEEELLVAAAAGVGTDRLLDAVGPLAVPVGAEAVDADVVRAERAESSATFVGVLQAAVGAFAALAVLVAVLVVANTWSVLLAQRVREQALLRCVGATRRDLWRSGLTEAALVGLVGGVAGLGLGWGAALLARAVAVAYLPVEVAAPLPGLLTVALALVLGVVSALLAALLPLRRAGGVHPLAALRPVEAVPDTARASLARRVVGALLVLGGATGTVVGATTGAVTQRLLLAMPSAFLAFVGVLVLATVLLPRVARWLAAGARAVGGPAAELAAASVGRNPRRTAATGSAVLIGVTLAVTAAVGAATLRASSTAYLAQYLPVDVTVAAPSLGPAEQDQLRSGLASVPGVASGLVAEELEVAVEVVAGPGGVEGESTGTSQTWVRAWAGDLDAVVAEVGAAPRDGSVTLSRAQAEDLGVSTGAVLRVASAEAVAQAPEGTSVDGTTLVVVVDATTPLPVRLPVAAARELGAAPTVLLALDAGLSRSGVETTVDEVTGLALERDEQAVVDSPALLLGSVQQTFDVLLAVVAGLLGVTVLIALVGVSTTVSLSLVERRQENALLRALGLSRSRLRQVVAWEALVLGAVGAVVGSALGVFYGVAGAYALIGAEQDVVVAVPWWWLVLLPLAVGLVAVLASVRPAHRAAAVAPAEALGAVV